ncbi:MAG: hypothetical protein IPK26_30055 [Planctomycetes bacterium]|nr:hypothetical protein [Planctomycetota bacterium]
MNRLPGLCVLLSVPLAHLTAQNLLSYRPNGPLSRLLEAPAASPAWVPPGGGPGVGVGVMNGPPRPVPPALLGAVEVDSTSGLVFSTNGQLSIERSFYPRLGCTPPAALPSLPIPAPVGSVTGMAFDPVLHHLFLTNGGMIFEVDPAAGMTIVCMWPAAILNILTGLDFDPAHPDRLMAVTSAGEVAIYSRCGMLLSAVGPGYPFPGGNAVGIARDRSDCVASSVYVLWDNGDTYDHGLSALHHAGGGGRVGLTYAATPTYLPSAGACGGSDPDGRIAQFAVEDEPGFAIEVCGLAAGLPFAALLIDLPPAPIGVALPGICGTTWVPIPALFVGFAPVAPGATTASVPLPLPPGLCGLRLYAQWFAPCAGPCGYATSDGMQLEISRR